MSKKVGVALNGPMAWMLAARPKTLTGAAVPVLMGLSLAFAYDPRGFGWLPAVLCLLFAFIMQVDANFVNDYFDFVKGTDDETRLGPRRACAQGWVTPAAMRRAIMLTTVLACIVGLPLIAYGGWQMILVGLLCVLFCFLYTTHLSYWGLGDVLVLLFFGVVPVCVTFYVQCHTVTMQVLVSSLACGLVIDALLVVNNYRDRDNDRRAGKRTIVVRLGARAAEVLYLLLGVVACLSAVVYLPQGVATACLPLIYLMAHVGTAARMRRINRGKALNAVLGLTARNIFIYGVLFSAGVIIDFVLRA